MFSRILDALAKTAAWRLSAPTTLAFATASAGALWFAYVGVSKNFRQRNDQWITGETGTLAEVAFAGSGDRSDLDLIQEAAERARHEVVAERDADLSETPQPVFFLMTSAEDRPLIWLGPHPREPYLSAIHRARFMTGVPLSILVKGWADPFRVVMRRATDGRAVFLGLSDRNANTLLREMGEAFFRVWLAMVFVGFAISWGGAQRVLVRVERITEAAAHIGTNDLAPSGRLGQRVPEGRGNDEIVRLAATFNRMLDRIENSIEQIRTLTDAVAHDVRSPITSIRGTLEMSLIDGDGHNLNETVASAVEALDRLSASLNTTLDVAEADAGLLHLRRQPVDLAALVREMVDLYQPAATERDLELASFTPETVLVRIDVDLMRRVLANLLDNVMHHVPAHSHATVSLLPKGTDVELAVSDNGPGFPAEIRTRAFGRFAKGKTSRGFGIGLAFVQAVARVHGGSAVIREGDAGGAVVALSIPREGEADGVKPLKAT